MIALYLTAVFTKDIIKTLGRLVGKAIKYLFGVMLLFIKKGVPNILIAFKTIFSELFKTLFTKMKFFPETDMGLLMKGVKGVYKRVLDLGKPFKYVYKIVKPFLSMIINGFYKLGVFVVNSIGWIVAGLKSLVAVLIGPVSAASAGLIAVLSAVAAAVGWLFGKGIVAGLSWLGKKFEWIGNTLEWVGMKAAEAWLFISKLWGGGIPKDPNAGKAAEIRGGSQQANLPSPSTMSGAYAQNSTGNKAMLAKMDAMISAINNQPQKQIQLERVRV